MSTFNVNAVHSADIMYEYAAMYKKTVWVTVGTQARTGCVYTQ